MRIHLVLRAIVVVFALSLAGCGGFSGGEKEPAADNKSVGKKRSAGMKAVVRDNLIVPGKRIGPVSVGMPVSQLYDVMGEPTQSVKERGSERYLFVDLQVVVDDTEGTVTTVSTESPNYATVDGLKAGLTDLAVKAGLAKLQGQLVIKEEGETTTYSESGIHIVVSGGLVRSISIRPVLGGT
jgi:hypothetical protein